MFCPGCGKDTQQELNFCNSCGINLQAVKQVMYQPQPTPRNFAHQPSTPQQFAPQPMAQQPFNHQPQFAPQQQFVPQQQQFAPVQMQIQETPMEVQRRKFKRWGLMTIGAGLLYATLIIPLAAALAEILPPIEPLMAAIGAFTSFFFIAGPMLMIYGRLMYKVDKNRPLIVMQQQPATPTFQVKPNAQTAKTLPQPPLQQSLPEYDFENYHYQPSAVAPSTQPMMYKKGVRQ